MSYPDDLIDLIAETNIEWDELDGKAQNKLMKRICQEIRIQKKLLERICQEISKQKEE
jgi:hypothetical protein